MASPGEPVLLFSHVTHEQLCRATEILWVQVKQQEDRMGVAEKRCEALEERVKQLESNEGYWRPTLDWVWRTFSDTIWKSMRSLSRGSGEQQAESRPTSIDMEEGIMGHRIDA